MRKRFIVLILPSLSLVVAAGPALACGGLVASNGTVNLVRTSTLAAYHQGVEHYVTSFEFAGAGGTFGSIVPLPGVPSNVRKGGRWTLQRLAQETQPPAPRALIAQADAAAVASSAEVLLETRIDALDVTILKGGGDAVGRWAEEHGFDLSPDAPEVLDFYAQRSPIFLAARYDVEEVRQRGIQRGDGTAVHVTIPTPNPWVPLRILALGKQKPERIEADVYLLTDDEPEMLPAPRPDSGLVLETSERASDALMADLRSDRGMKWMPTANMWLSYLKVDTTAGKLVHDLAVDATGVGAPSPVAAGLRDPVDVSLQSDGAVLWPWIAAALVVLGSLALADRFVASRV